MERVRCPFLRIPTRISSIAVTASIPIPPSVKIDRSFACYTERRKTKREERQFAITRVGKETGRDFRAQSNDYRVHIPYTTQKKLITDLKRFL
jgi:hypothetical protein